MKEIGNMTIHSKTPWTCPNGSRIYAPDGKLVATTAFECRGTKEIEANAALIVQAVNSHAPLIAALRGMLDAYWPANADGSNGDGGKPPRMVIRAIAALYEAQR